ncbi:MAG: 4-hydroxy-3-methylbut-2-enyl diphosphate reductase [Treponema sp.]|jgi:4-hydroxy-3-methylbut-2-enyl diphosphate reductase|nr:4-hydroxy-3-methylbut-2-enyl diphosphate reductase [Treponema sp.]
MTVIRARVLGFCMGVRRAVEMAEAEAGRKPVRTMGPLIHNPQVLASLRDRGVEMLDEGELPADLGGLTVIIRAHGISPALEEELLRHRAALTDATCPLVKKNQREARSLEGAGFSLFIAGEKRHGEIAGLQGYAPGGTVVSDAAEAAQAALSLSRRNPAAKTALIGQTTIGVREYAAIGEAIRGRFPGLKVVDSICGAVRERQESLRELCGRVDAVVIAGGRLSSNTRRLLDIARSLKKPAWLVESAAELTEALAAEIGGYQIVGLSAGASTPDSVINEIETKIRLLSP